MKIVSGLIGILIAVSVYGQGTVYAHQPRIVESTEITITDPEISKAYYGELTGEPHVYRLDAKEPFNLYVNVLVPDIAGQKKDVSAVIFKDAVEIVALEGSLYPWKQFVEPFGNDKYWMGPEYRARGESGQYEIRVYSSNNDSKYSLAVGEIEAFDGKEGMNALSIIPKLKSEYFNTSPATFIFSPLGWGVIVVLYGAAFVFGLIYRAVFLRVAGKVGFLKRNQVQHKNIGGIDRLLRLVIAVGLLVWAVFTTWNPLVIFLSGVVFFEAVFSWCLFYAAIGKNTCSIK